LSTDSIRADIAECDRISHLRVTGETEDGFDEPMARLDASYGKHAISPDLLNRYNQAWAEVQAMEAAIRAHLAETGQAPPPYAG
jgi:hypothetical protein